MTAAQQTAALQVTQHNQADVLTSIPCCCSPACRRCGGGVHACAVRRQSRRARVRQQCNNGSSGSGAVPWQPSHCCCCWRAKALQPAEGGRVCVCQHEQDQARVGQAVGGDRCSAGGRKLPSAQVRADSLVCCTLLTLCPAGVTLLLQLCLQLIAQPSRTGADSWVGLGAGGSLCALAALCLMATQQRWTTCICCHAMV